jgi:hypothetical protein
VNLEFGVFSAEYCEDREYQRDNGDENQELAWSLARAG